MVNPKSVITLTTDFGLSDPFVGIMKGVILTINPLAQVVDITHGVERHNIEEALNVLSCSFHYFPDGTIHVVVVDPGVGTGRRPLLVQGEGSFFLAPDNGVLSFLFNRDPGCRVHSIESDRYLRKPVSRTFHGRDVFAPVAAWLSRGIDPDSLGPVITDYTRLNIPQLMISGNGIRGEIIHVDRFGNMITNILRSHIDSLEGEKSGITAEVKGIRIGGLYSSYEENRADRPGLIINSFDALEIFCYRGNAREVTGLNRGDRVFVFLQDSPVKESE